MRLTAGRTLSRYEILGPLGAGAMGEVYRARDTRLDREVALKILPHRLAADPERLARFDREARSLATLNHPNVAQIFHVDRADSVRFLVLELVPGETLHERIVRGPLPVGEAVDLCRQIAEGLEAAHEAGVIHRDLKPANVRITPAGQVKVLDFGLAKSTGCVAGRSPTADNVLSTAAGRLLGTPTYMAPEQVRGAPIDRRVDVWAFGCVLYECLTGRRAFAGPVPGDVLVAVLDEDPDWTRLPPHLPARLHTLVKRCLDKDRRSRLRDIGEARVLLEQAPDESPKASGIARGPSRLIALAVITLVAVTCGVAGTRWALGNAATDPPAIRQWSLTTMAGMEEMPAVSPDGGKVAFVSRVDGRRQIFLRLLSRGSPEPITRGTGEHLHPRWADNDTLIYVRRSGSSTDRSSLWEMDYLGSSSPQLLADGIDGEADVDPIHRRIAILPAGNEDPALIIVERDPPRSRTVIELPTAMYRCPRWSPDGRHVAVEALVALNRTEIRVIDVATEESTTVVKTAQARGLTWRPDGSGFVYASSTGSTLAYPPVFSLRTVNLDGSGDAALPWDSGGYASYVEPDLTRDGRLVACRVALESDVYRFPVDGTPWDNVDRAERITHQTGLVQVPSVSPDDREVAFVSDSGGRADIWVTPADGSGTSRRLTNEQDPTAVIGIPVWSPRGDWIVYYRGPMGRTAEEWLVSPKGAGYGHELLVEARGAAAWSPDGEWVYYMPDSAGPANPSTSKIRVADRQVAPVRRNATALTVSSDNSTAYFSRGDDARGQGELWRASPVKTGEPELVVSGLQSRVPLWPHHYTLSPDDRWLATPLCDHGTTNLWLISTEDHELRQVTDFGERATMICRQVSWSSDSAHIFAALMETDADIVVLEGLPTGD